MTEFHEAVFRWPRTDAGDVIVTGTFDQWSKSTHLKRTPTGFETSIKVPWSEKVIYKFVVDGRWVTSGDQPTERDGSGNLNHVYFSPSKPAPPPVEDVPAVEPLKEEEKLGNGTLSEKVVESVSAAAGQVHAAVVAPVVEFADKFIDEPVVKPPVQEASAEVPVTPAPEAIPSPQVLPEVPVTLVPALEPVTDVSSSPTAVKPNGIAEPVPLETLVVPGAATSDVAVSPPPVVASHVEEPSTHTGRISDAIAPPPYQVATTPEVEHPVALGPAPTPPAKENGVVKAASPPTTPAKDRSFSFPKNSEERPSRDSSTSSPPTTPTGTSKFKGTERKKRNSIFGKLKDIFHHDKEKEKEHK